MDLDRQQIPASLTRALVELLDGVFVYLVSYGPIASLAVRTPATVPVCVRRRFPFRSFLSAVQTGAFIGVFWPMLYQFCFAFFNHFSLLRIGAAITRIVGYWPFTQVNLAALDSAVPIL